MLVDGRWRMIQKYMVYWSACCNSEVQGLPECLLQFLNTDHRLVVATLKFQLKYRRMVPSQPRLNVGKLKDESGGEEFANRLSGDLGGLGALGDPEELWRGLQDHRP